MHSEWLCYLHLGDVLLRIYLNFIHLKMMLTKITNWRAQSNRMKSSSSAMSYNPTIIVFYEYSMWCRIVCLLLCTLMFVYALFRLFRRFKWKFDFKSVARKSKKATKMPSFIAYNYPCYLRLLFFSADFIYLAVNKLSYYFWIVW